MADLPLRYSPSLVEYTSISSVALAFLYMLVKRQGAFQVDMKGPKRAADSGLSFRSNSSISLDVSLILKSFLHFDVVLHTYHLRAIYTLRPLKRSQE